jgi:hypothetical protein
MGHDELDYSPARASADVDARSRAATLSADPKLRRLLRCVVLAAGVILAATLMQSRISVADVDAYSYVLGAYSIQAGHGYKDLGGYPLNHWPPGYSILLSFFRNPLSAALFINYASLGIATGCLYPLMEDAGWSPVAACAATLVMGLGFFRSIAIFAKPDILDYAIFLIGLRWVTADSRRWRTLGACLWSVLIPIKLVAAVFAPAAVVADFLARRERRPLRLEQYGLIMAVWGIGIGTVFAFNRLTIGAFAPPFEAASIRTLVGEAGRFGFSFFRDLLANWYGTIKPVERLLPFLIVLAIAIACLSMLRPRQRGARYAYLGGAILELSWLLELRQDFYADARLMGYGLIVLLLALRPRDRSEKLWMAYACATMMLAFGNAVTVNSLGANDPRYARLAQTIMSARPPREQIFSNSYHLLDIQARVPSVPVHSLDEVPPGALLMMVKLPNFDGISHTIWPLTPPARTWPVLANWDHATLYRKPSAPRFSGR